MIVVRHSGRDAGIQSQRCEAYRAYKIKHLCNRQITVHGLDFGIHAEMTDFPAFPSLCITSRAGAWEPARLLLGSCF